MKKAVFTIILQILVMVAYADNSMDAESSRRIHHLCELYNNDLNDSLLHQGPIDLEYHKRQECWENYYETWMHIVNTYVFMGKVNMGLQEVKRMHQDATERKNKYGMALAYYAMGNVYITRQSSATNRALQTSRKPTRRPPPETISILTTATR